MQRHLEAMRREEMSIIVWPWAGWIIGLTAILGAVFLIAYAKKTNILTKGIVGVVIGLAVLGVVFIVGSPIESFEGDRNRRMFIIRRLAIWGGGVQKMKWSQIRAVDVVMGGKVDNYNNTLHYRIEFESTAHTRIRCLETSDRKKAKERVDWDNGS